MQDKRKPLSGFQRRKLRVARGIPEFSPAEVAARAARGKRIAAGRIAANLQFVTDLKLQMGCTDCGYKEHPAALDFDHLPGQEKCRGVARMLSVSRSTLLAEIAKCEVVCANCHRVRTWNRRRSESDS